VVLDVCVVVCAYSLYINQAGRCTLKNSTEDQYNPLYTTVRAEPAKKLRRRVINLCTSIRQSATLRKTPAKSPLQSP